MAIGIGFGCCKGYIRIGMRTRKGLRHDKWPGDEALEGLEAEAAMLHGGSGVWDEGGSGRESAKLCREDGIVESDHKKEKSEAKEDDVGKECRVTFVLGRQQFVERGMRFFRFRYERAASFGLNRNAWAEALDRVLPKGSVYIGRIFREGYAPELGCTVTKHAVDVLVDFDGVECRSSFLVQRGSVSRFLVCGITPKLFCVSSVVGTIMSDETCSLVRRELKVQFGSLIEEAGTGDLIGVGTKFLDGLF